MKNVWLFSLLVGVLSFASICIVQAQQGGTPVKELQQWAERGDADAQFELGIRQITGEGVEKNEAEGLKWVKKAAEQNHLRAQHILGSLYEDGVAVEKDLVKAAEWYTKAADAGLPMAQHSLGILNDLGRGVKKDPAKAAQWFQKAASQGYAPAQAAYASKVERGEGVEKNTAKAALWYLKSSQQGYVPAMTRLAYLYYTGSGVPVDYRRAAAWYLRASRSDEPWATNDLAWFLATCPDPYLQNGDEAVQQAKIALKMLAEAGAEERHEMVDTMAAALARNGEFMEAILWQKKAIALLAEDKDVTDEERKELEAEFKSRLALYQDQKPYTDKEEEGEKGATALPQDTILQEENLPQGKPKSSKPKRSRGTVV
ncbi:MAG: SEL1-like repeat protein [Verrucomicrobiales bacterium]|nr:SEL1-like repeat protein [Verrucomicrobiales bacterium]